MKNKEKLKQKSKKKLSFFDIILYLIFAIMSLIMIYPFYYVFIISFSNTQASAEYSPYLYPHVFDLTGYKMIINDLYFFKSLLTTLFVTVVGTSLNMIVSIITAYALSKKRLIGRNYIIMFIVFTMLFSGGLIPTYLVVSNIGLTDSIWAMIFPSMLSTYYIIIMKNYFASLPQSLEDAAKIDGANDFKILLKVYLPISKPFMATFTLFYAVERWNEWWNAYLYISDKNIKPLQIYLRDMLVNFSSQLSTQAQSIVNSQTKVYVQSVQMATIVIALLPIMCLYPFLQKYFVKGVMIGAIKE